MNNKLIEQQEEYEAMMEQLNQLGNMIKVEIRERAKKELDQYMKEVMK